MGRPSKPWRRDRGNGAGDWYATIDGKQVRVAAKEASFAEAADAMHAIKADPEKAERLRTAESVSDVVIAYLEHCDDRIDAREMEAITLQNYRYHLLAFAESVGEVAAAKVRPHHVLGHFERREWGQETRRGASIIVRACWRWAANEGLLPDDPLTKLRIPPARRRQFVMDSEQVAEFARHIISPAFRDLFTVLRETGCRPADARRVEARFIDFEAMLWKLPEHKTRRYTLAAKQVVMTEAAAAICRRLAAENPDGPIFRSPYGKVWSMRMIGNHFRYTRAKAGLGKEAVAYALRHGFVTDALERGVPEPLVAALVGHKTTQIIARNYNRLSDRTVALRRELDKVRPGGLSAATPEDPPGYASSPAPPDSPAPSPPPASSPGSRRGRRRK